MKKDIFSESKRLAEITQTLREAFELWGYREVFLPSVEKYKSTLRRGLKVTYENEFYLVKPDITSQIVGKLKNEKNLRVYYISEVLDGIEGKWQAGLEFIGGKNLQREVEGLSIILSTLARLEIDDFFIDIGSLAAWERAIAGIEEHKEEIFDALKKRNLGLIDSLPIKDDKKDELWELLNFRGKQSGMKKLDSIVQVLDDERVFIDFGTIRPLPYYEDLIFEIYSPHLGYPIGAGGEYLVNKNQKAFGFAFDLEALKEVYTSNPTRNPNRIKGNIKTAYRKARKLVQNGEPVDVSFNKELKNGV